MPPIKHTHQLRCNAAFHLGNLLVALDEFNDIRSLQTPVYTISITKHVSWLLMYNPTQRSNPQHNRRCFLHILDKTAIKEKHASCGLTSAFSWAWSLCRSSCALSHPWIDMPDCTTRSHGTSHTQTSLTARTRRRCEFWMLQISNRMIARLPTSYWLSVRLHACMHAYTHRHYTHAQTFTDLTAH